MHYDLSDYEIKNGVLTRYLGGTSLVIIPEEVKIIADGCFENCDRIVHVYMHDSVTRVGNYAFFGCKHLEDVHISAKLKSIGKEAFSSCKRLKKISFPKGLEHIGKGAFFENLALKEISLPEGLKSIGSYAFYACEGLESVTIPSSAGYVGKRAFFLCKGLKEAVLQGEIGRMGKDVFGGCPNLKITASEDTFSKILQRCEERDEFIALRLAKDAPLLPCEQRFIRSHIQDMFFVAIRKSDSRVLKRVLEQIKPLPWQAVEEMISELACKGPEFIAVLIEYKNKHYPPEKLAHLKAREEAKELGLIPRTLAEWRKIYSFSKEDGEITIERYLKKDQNVVVPEVIGGCKVTKLGLGAFEKQRSLCSVILPESVTQIGDCAFYKCVNLKKVTFSQSLRVIGTSAFFGCRNLELDKMPGRDAKVGQRAFFGCEKLADIKGFIIEDHVLYDCFGSRTEITIPEGIIKIEGSAFGRFSAHNYGGPLAKLRSVRFPKSLKRIEARAFQGCMDLQDVILQEGILEIGEFAFAHCRALTEISLPKGLEFIGKSAFWDCSNLKSVSIPAEVRVIGERVFGHCLQLETVTILGRDTMIAKDAFTALECICAPADSYARAYAEENGIMFEAI